MWLVLTALLLQASSKPEFDWYWIKLPTEITEHEVSRGKVGLAVAPDGRQFVVVATHGAFLRAGDKFERKWQTRFDVPCVWDVAFLDERRIIVSTNAEILLISVEDGRVIKRLPTQVDKFAVLASGHLVSAVHRTDRPGMAHALFSPEDGKLLFTFDHRILNPTMIVADRSGTRFATGSLLEKVWIGDVYTRANRELTTRPANENYVHALCFDPTGRYLAAGMSRFNVAVLDLLEGPVEFRKSPRHLGKFRKGKDEDLCRGIGFIHDKWLWVGSGRDLDFYQWPNLEPVDVEGRSGDGSDFFTWRASANGELLVGVTLLGTVEYGRLKKAKGETRDADKAPARSETGETTGRGDLADCVYDN